MGAAAYRRGSKAIADQILMDHGRYRDPTKAKPRPAAWGEKALARAEARARSLLLARFNLGLREVTAEELAEQLVDLERVGQETALSAARAALAKGGKRRAHAQPPRGVEATVSRLEKLLLAGKVILGERVSVGPYQTATGKPGFALLGTGRSAELSGVFSGRKGAEEAARAFIRIVTAAKASEAADRAEER